MKKNIFTLGLIAFMGFATVSCSTDDSDMNTDTTADGIITNTNNGTTPPIDNGDKDLPKPPMKP